MPADWRVKPEDHLENGIGAVLFPPDRSASPTYFATRMPRWLLAEFGSRRQFIFLLEALGQCLSLWIFAANLAGNYLSFCDNYYPNPRIR